MPEKLFESYDESSFKKQFITNFLAAWVAENYAECCSRERHAELSNPPVEDAVMLADAAWDRMCEVDLVESVTE